MRQYRELSSEKKTIEQHLPILEKIFSKAQKLRDLLDLEFVRFFFNYGCVCVFESVATGYEDDKTDVMNKHRKVKLQTCFKSRMKDIC